MSRRSVTAGLAAALLIASCAAPRAASRPWPHLPGPTALLAAQPIAPNGALIREGERLRTLELDELAPLRLRLTVRF